MDIRDWLSRWWLNVDRIWHGLPLFTDEGWARHQALMSVSPVARRVFWVIAGMSHGDKTPEGLLEPVNFLNSLDENSAPSTPADIAAAILELRAVGLLDEQSRPSFSLEFIS